MLLILYTALRASCNLYTLYFHARLFYVSSASILGGHPRRKYETHAAQDHRPFVASRSTRFDKMRISRRSRYFHFLRVKRVVDGAPLSIAGQKPLDDVANPSHRKMRDRGKREKGETDTNNSPLLPRIYLCHSVTKQASSENDLDDKSFAGSITALRYYLAVLRGML